MQKWILVAGAAALALIGLTSCQRQTGDVRIMASFNDMTQPFFVAMRRSALDEARKLGVDLMIVDAQSNSAKQTTDVRTAVATGTQGVIIAPSDVNALTPAIDYIIDADVPVATVDRRVDNASRPVAHFGADNVAGGRVMAQYVLDRFPQGARIIVLTGSPGSSSGIDRGIGIHEVLDAAGPKYQIVAEQTAMWQRDQGLTVTQNILTALGSNHPQAIIAHDDDMALGAVEALRSAGLKNVMVIGFNAAPEALKMVKSGEMAATVEQSPSLQIRAALDQLVENIRQGKPLTGAIVKPILITRDNLQDAERLSEIE